MIVSMLTTEDNPYDPFDDYDEWYAFDERNGYGTPSYLARIVVNSYDISETDQNVAITKAIDEIVAVNLLGIYKKVSREM